MLGGLMLADFRYDPAPSGEDVVVELFWDDATRMGRIIMPDHISEAAAISNLPDPGPLPTISAVAYALVLAAESGLCLRLSGDPSVWPSEWGSLLQAH